MVSFRKFVCHRKVKTSEAKEGPSVEKVKVKDDTRGAVTVFLRRLLQQKGEVHKLYENEEVFPMLD